MIGSAKKNSLTILIASGVNLDLLGTREPSIYGTDTLADMKKLVGANFNKIPRAQNRKSFKLNFFQTNDEARFLAELGKGYVGAVINAGAWTHTSLAIADRLSGLSLPFVEAHVSDLSKREEFRQHSYLAPHALATVQGLGIQSYWVALEALLAHLATK